MKKENLFHKDLTDLINRYSLETTSNVPDFILADYLISCLKAFDKTNVKSNNWHSKGSRHSIELYQTRSEI